MNDIKLTDLELWTIINGLRAACDQYSTDAAAADKANQPRVASAFRDQRATACVLINKLEERT